MLYGLVNAPSLLQGFMNEVFWEYLHYFVLFYIDDILMYSWNLTEHCQHIWQVLDKLREY